MDEQGLWPLDKAAHPYLTPEQFQERLRRAHDFAADACQKDGLTGNLFIGNTEYEEFYADVPASDGASTSQRRAG